MGRRWAWGAEGWAEGAVDMGVVCIVGVDASAGMSNDETTQKRKINEKTNKLNNK